eukprot:TRINITY_DN13511_c0_g1_i1.p1 TRINITY_DN13511_c0_g1~~TRINITY_DN13511_c0_g1_i1.p1  ORF type:complete len:626 (+),score=76.57 TRINITY_DN13511_c0_g1_i1:50-1927(+)
MGYSSVRGYLGTAVMRTICWSAIVSLVAFCDDESHAGGMITKCTMHESLREPILGWIWVLSIDLLVLLMFIGSLHNVYCNGQQQSAISNVIAPLTAAFVFAGCGVTMGSVGVWWGFVGSGCYMLGPGIIIAVKGRSILTRKFMLNMFFRFLHTWDVVTDFATAVILGTTSTTGKIYIALSASNLLMYIGSLLTNLGEDSLPRIVLNMIKALTLDIPMLVLDIYVLLEGGRNGEEQAVIIVSALSSLLESVASIKAALTFREVSKHHTRMKKTISIAEGIASALARFDIDTAEVYLEPYEGSDSKDVNAELLVAFRSLVSNLKMYRPYLPDAMFAQSCPTKSFRSVSVAHPARTTSVAKRIAPSPLQLAQHQPVIPPTLSQDIEGIDLTALVIRHIASQETRTPDTTSTQRIVTGFLEAVFDEAEAFNGVLQAFDTGYEVAITFGAVTKDNSLKDVRRQAQQAYRCGVALYNKFKQRERSLVGIGIASGCSVVGNFGTEGKLSFCVAGPIIHIARTACEHSVLFKENLVIDPQMRNRICSADAKGSSYTSHALKSLYGYDQFYTLSTSQSAVDACCPTIKDSQQFTRRTSLSSISLHIDLGRQESNPVISCDDATCDDPEDRMSDA